MIEIIITSGIVGVAVYIITKSIKKSAQGKCDCGCGSCSNKSNCNK